MGVTIHFDGQLLGEEAYDAAIRLATDFAREKQWPANDIPAARRELQRVRNDQDWDYEGITKGLELLPHPDCEPVRLEFDDQLYVQEYTKTQFAPIDVHVSIVALLSMIAPCFLNISVNDEGEFFETANLAQLIAHRTWCNKVIEEHKRTNPQTMSAIKLPSGRIIDMYD